MTDGVFELPRGLIKVSGPDSMDFLQRVTSQDIKSLSSDQGGQAALLTGSGNIISIFDIYNCGQYYLISVERENLKTVVENLEKIHFAEDLLITDVSEDFRLISVQGHNSQSALTTLFGKVPKRYFEIVGVEEALIAKRSDFSSLGFHVFAKRENALSIRDRLKVAGIATLNNELWKSLRADSGNFTFGQDITDKNLIMEAPVVHAISRDKGCYPGQETVERIFTYGNISKKLMGLRFSSKVKVQDTRVKLLAEGNDAGYVTSTHFIPWKEQTIGFGMVRKPYFEPGQKLHVEGYGVTAEVFTLPESFEIKKS